MIDRIITPRDHDISLSDFLKSKDLGDPESDFAVGEDGCFDAWLRPSRIYWTRVFNGEIVERLQVSDVNLRTPLPRFGSGARLEY